MHRVAGLAIRLGGLRGVLRTGRGSALGGVGSLGGVGWVGCAGSKRGRGHDARGRTELDACTGSRGWERCLAGGMACCGREGEAGSAAWGPSGELGVWVVRAQTEGGATTAEEGLNWLHAQGFGVENKAWWAAWRGVVEAGAALGVTGGGHSGGLGLRCRGVRALGVLRIRWVWVRCGLGRRMIRLVVGFWVTGLLILRVPGMHSCGRGVLVRAMLVAFWVCRRWIGGSLPRRRGGRTSRWRGCSWLLRSG